MKYTLFQKCNYEDRETERRGRSEEDQKAENREAVIWGHEAFRRDALGDAKDIIYAINDKNAKAEEAQRLEKAGLVRKDTTPAQTTLKMVGIENPSIYDQDDEPATAEHEQVA